MNSSTERKSSSNATNVANVLLVQEFYSAIQEHMQRRRVINVTSVGSVLIIQGCSGIMKEHIQEKSRLNVPSVISGFVRRGLSQSTRELCIVERNLTHATIVTSVLAGQGFLRCT